MSKYQQSGARVELVKRVPSIDLVNLIEQLADALNPEYNSADPLFSAQSSGPNIQNNRFSGCLNVHTPKVLSRLVNQPTFVEKFAAGPKSGFVRDDEQMPWGRDAIVGGKIHTDRLQDLPLATKKLKKAVSRVLDAHLQSHNHSLERLLTENAQDYFENLSKKIKTTKAGNISSTTIAPLRFLDTNQEEKPPEKFKQVARLIAATEEVKGNWIEGFISSAKKKLARQDMEEDEIDAVIENFIQEAESPYSQTARFEHFLEDFAMSRLRMEVSFAIMKAIRDAAQKNSAYTFLVKYINNILNIKEEYFDTDKALDFNLGGNFQGISSINLSERMQRSLFYSCLPIWPHPKTQLFESRSSGQSLFREIGYRFRVNGKNPQTGKSALKSRIDNIKDVLTESKDSQKIEKAVSELLYLMIVIPHKDENRHDMNCSEKFKKLQENLDKHGINKIIEWVGNKDFAMKKISTQLVQVLKKHGSKIINSAQQKIQNQYLCVKKGVVDWERLETATGNTKDFFIRNSEPGIDERVPWFDHIQVTGDLSNVPNLLTSIPVSTKLVERILYSVEDKNESLKVQRKIDGKMLPVSFLPCIKTNQNELQILQNVPNWCGLTGLNILVDESQLGVQKNSGNEYSAQQLRAAKVVAFALLTYTVLWVIRDRLAFKEENLEKILPRLLLLRVQKEGKPNPKEEKSLYPSGSQVLYAVSQALELSLGEESQVFMQGFTLDNENRYRNMGTYAALTAGFPIILEHLPPHKADSESRPVGLVNYTTRPCNQHADEEDNIYLFTSKTYISKNTQDPFNGRVLQEVRTRLYVQEKEKFLNPDVILEEIARLELMGCKHIMLLWQHYGGRRIGKTADRHSVHSKPDFLERLSERFPDITLYMLRREDFPAIRLMQKNQKINAFEVLRVSDHENFMPDGYQDNFREIIPVYTFATLVVVGDEDNRPQSGFCTYFLEFDYRLSKLEWAEKARANLVDPNRNSTIRPALIETLRGLHYLHAEKPALWNIFVPKLQPYDWINPSSIEGAGELKIITAKGKNSVVLSFPAILAKVGAIFRSEKS